MQAVTFDSANGDHLDSIKRPWFPAIKYLFTLGDRIRHRVDLGQSQSGNSSLSPQAYRVENTTAELALSEILPITSVRAPRYFVGRSRKGAKATCERWQDRSVASDYRDPVADNPPFSNVLMYSNMYINIIARDISRQSFSGRSP
jgi:hypothetical protein